MPGISRSMLLGLYMFLSLGAPSEQAQQSRTPSSSADVSPKNSDSFKLTVQVKRVILDVVVTDAKDNPVAGLGRDDFKVLEDGVVQPIRSFDEHAPTPASAIHQPLSLHLPPNTFTNLTLAPAGESVTVLLYDMLNTPQAALPFAHEELIRFIKERKYSGQVAIFVLTDRLHLLQGFTDDETRMMRAVDSTKANSRISQLRTADTGADEAALLAPDPAASSSPTQPIASPSAADAVLSQLNEALKDEQSFQDSQRIQVTVEAFADIARFVASLPGRKSLIWMSGSFPVEIWPGRRPLSTAAGDFNIAARFDTEIRETQQVLKDGRVAIYPVDVRGLRTDPQFGVSTTAPRLPTQVPITGGGAPPPPSFGVQDSGEHATMDAIAASSGGRAFYNTNGLQEAMDAAVRQSSIYYTLTYAPTNNKDDGGERKIKVELKNPNYRLSYRELYLAPDDAHPNPYRPLALDMNMQHGAPDSSQLFFEAGIVPVGGVMAATPAEVAELKTFLQRYDTGKLSKMSAEQQKVQHYEINLAMIGRQLEMPPTENGNFLTSMQFGLAAYTQDGKLLNGAEISIKNAIPSAQFQKIQSDGYHASMVFAVPPDADSLRIAVRDEISHRIGTIEIPVPIAAAKDSAPSAPISK